MDGGALSWNETLDLETAIDKALLTGIGRYIAKGKTGVVLQVTAPGRLPFTDTASNRRVKTLVVKVMPLQDLTTPNITLVATSESNIRKEFRRQEWLNETCIRKYGFSIFPTPIYYKTTTFQDLATKFPYFHQLLKEWNVTQQHEKIGVIFMELANANGKAGTMADSHSKRANALCRRMLFMLAMLGFVHGDFHKGNFFQSGRGFMIGDLGEARQLTSYERDILKSYLKNQSSKQDMIRLLYGLYEHGRDFTSQYYEPIQGDEKFNSYVQNYQWVRTDDIGLSTAVDDVEFASVKEVKKSLGYSKLTRRHSL